MDDGEAVLAHLRAKGFLVEDQGLLFIGPAAEQEFGRRHFMDLLATFTADLELRVVAGRRKIGTVSPLALQLHGGEAGAQRILLAGWAWKVESVDWQRREIVVSEQPEKGTVRWPGEPVAEAFELVRAQREVLLGATPDVVLSRRAQTRLAVMREEMAEVVDEAGLVLADRDDRREFWTWAGLRANETLAAALGLGAVIGTDNRRIVLEPHITLDQIRSAPMEAAVPAISPEAVDGMKFSAALPVEMARATLAERYVERKHATQLTRDPIFHRTGGI